jgi:hypothetical protein
VFASGATKIDSLRHQVQVYCRSLAANFMKTATERPMFRSVASFVAPVRPSFSFAFQEDGEYSRANF